MKICYTKTHGEIVHDEADCPICDLLETKDIEYQDLKEDTDKEIMKLKEEKLTLEKQIEKLEEGE